MKSSIGCKAQKSTHTHTHTHTHGCLCKLIFSIAVAMIIFPSYPDPVQPSYDINAGANSADCVSDTLHATSGNVNLNANWSANTVNITYYSDNSQFTTGSCTYDQSLLIPQTEPTKTGYTFGGWRVRVANAVQSTINLLNLTPEINSDRFHHRGYSYGYGEKCLENEMSCVWDYEEGESVCDINVYSDQENCSDSKFSHLNAGEWSINFREWSEEEYDEEEDEESYANVFSIKGISLCSTTSPLTGHDAGYSSTGWAAVGTPDESNNGEYCWCKVTGYTDSFSYNFQPVINASWVAGNGVNAVTSKNFCQQHCAARCISNMVDGSTTEDFIMRLFGHY